MSISEDDIRAATAAGILDESQAANLLTLAHKRTGRLAKGLPDDEPFELFRGFAEIFVSLGLILLISAAIGFVAVMSSGFFVFIVMVVLCWWAATYFTRKRRMTLPSITLVSGYGIGVSGLIWQLAIMNDFDHANEAQIFAVSGLIGILAMLFHYRSFRVPFSMFIAGLFGLTTILALVEMITGQGLFTSDWETFFDLRQGGAMPVASLVFGICAFAAGLWFDVRDPHRVGRMARSAFWLHLLAAPALVNTLMMTAYNIGDGLGMILTLLGFALITIFALVIDRRSFLTAGLGYLAAVIIWALQTDGTGYSIPIMMLVLGGIVTYLGTFWTALRVRLMKALPDFPGKTRLPPYAG